MKKLGIICFAALVALVLPCVLSPLVYPAAQVFLPEGNIILTPAMRVICTILIAIIDYFAAGFILIRWCKEWFTKIWPHVITGTLTFMWCIFIGVIWFISVID